VRYTWRRLAHLGWDTIGHWQERGFGFASHTASHPRLTWLPDAEAAAELERSRETLRHRLGSQAARAVAYPFGARDERIERLARAAGYELGFGGVRGGGARNGSPLALARLPVYVWDVGGVPFGLRKGGLGRLGRAVAHAANRCAVGTSLMRKLLPL
jgi:peptidoglycan/xylan/chitin deacetylase (PgdA/CDA1 family)